MDAADVLAADAAHVWHPYASVGATPFGVVTGAEGVRLSSQTRQSLSTRCPRGGQPSTATATRTSMPP